MLSAPVAATASVANLFRGSGKKAKPAPAPAPTPAAAPAPATSPPAAKPTADEETLAGVALAGDDGLDLVRAALASKRMSRTDFGRVVDARSASTGTSKTAVADRLLALLTKQNVKVG